MRICLHVTERMFVLLTFAGVSKELVAASGGSGGILSVLAQGLNRPAANMIPAPGLKRRGESIWN
jgi:hypothetical protein